MKTKIKDEILETAKKLFNQQGYDAVSMRDIAKELGISVGNLTYHYPKKTDIVLALMTQTRYPEMQNQNIQTFEDLDLYIRRLLRSVIDHFFYFQNVGHFMSEPALKESELTNSIIVRENFLLGLDHLIADGYFVAAFTSELAHTLGNFIMLSHYNWAQYTLLNGRDADEAIETFTRDHWKILAPYFSEQGKREYAEKIAPTEP